jgi:hypothetical protein
MSFYIQYPASAAGTNPSVSTNGAPIPGSSTLVAGENPSGDQQPLQTDSSGYLYVDIASSSGLANPLPTKDAADGTPGAANPVLAIQVAGTDGTDLRTLSTNASGQLNINNVSGMVSLPTGASTSALQTTGNTTLSTIAANQTNGTQETNIIGTVPLPTGASTAALQSNVQSAPGTPQTVALTIQGNASSIAVPISGTVTVTQSTASNLNATIVGTTAAGSGSATNLVTIQGNAAGTPVPVSGTVSATNSANGNTGAAVPAQATQVGGTDGTDLRALSVNSSGQLNINNISGTVSLPTLASTSTNQATIIANQTNGTQTSIVTQATAANLNATVVGTTAAGSGASTGLLTIQGNASGTPIPVSGSVTTAGTTMANAPVYNVYSSTNITTSAYVQLVASTSNVINNIHIFDSSGQAMIFAIGASGSEVNQLYVQPGGDTYNFHIPAGTRISYKALTSTASTGYLLMSFLE